MTTRRQQFENLSNASVFRYFLILEPFGFGKLNICSISTQKCSILIKITLLGTSMGEKRPARVKERGHRGFLSPRQRDFWLRWPAPSVAQGFSFIWLLGLKRNDLYLFRRYITNLHCEESRKFSLLLLEF